jgi:glycerol uptake facilitator-like aquaporin
MSENKRDFLAIFAALGALFAAFASWHMFAPAFERFLQIATDLGGWVEFKIRVMFEIQFVRHWLFASAVGTALCLVVPWWMEPHGRSDKTQTKLRLYASAMSFSVALYLNQSMLGFLVAIFSGFSGPMTGMVCIRTLMNCRWLKHPPSLKPTLEEAHEKLSVARAAEATKPPEPTP